MIDAERFTVPVETRASEDGPRLIGTILTEGRASTGSRAELFTPGAATWPADGIDIRTEHLGRAETRAVPVRGANGELCIDAKATPAIFAAVQSGKRYMSVEFHALAERRTAAGVREVQRALLVGATVTDRPEYDTTAAEVRERSAVRVWL